MRLAFASLLLTTALAAQTRDQTGLVHEARELRAAIQNGSFTQAVEIINDLDEKVQTQQRSWLIRDASERVDEVLSWLPVDAESLWVNQEPFVIKSQDSLDLLYSRPAQAY